MIENHLIPTKKNSRGFGDGLIRKVASVMREMIMNRLSYLSNGYKKKKKKIPF